MADQVASKMSKTNPNATASKTSMPKKGENYHCNQCGMEIHVTKECGCKSGDHAHFQCCNEEMAKA
ncbi:hypothetical protein BH10PLA2_BH10PLA2_18120 [soil metagenome]